MSDKVWNNVDEMVTTLSLRMFGLGVVLALGAWAAAFTVFGAVIAVNGAPTDVNTWLVIVTAMALIVSVMALLMQPPGRCRRVAFGCVVGNLIFGGLWFAALALY